MRNLPVLLTRPAMSPMPKNRKPVSVKPAVWCFAYQAQKTQAGGILSPVPIGVTLTGRRVRLTGAMMSRWCRFHIMTPKPMRHGLDAACQTRRNGNMPPPPVLRRSTFGAMSAQMTAQKWPIHGRAVFRFTIIWPTVMPSARRSAAFGPMISRFMT